MEVLARAKRKDGERPINGAHAPAGAAPSLLPIVAVGLPQLEMPEFRAPLETLHASIHSLAKPHSAGEIPSHVEQGSALVMYACEGENFEELVEALLKHFPHATLLLFKDSPTEEQVSDAIRAGAEDLLPLTVSPEELRKTVRKSLARSSAHTAALQLRAQIERRYSFHNIIAGSRAMGEVFDVLKKVSDYRTTVMILGESGVGKELVARALHYNSPRRSGRFVAINCGAIPENLLESELFGHKKGAFTDASRDKKGLIEEADGGTLFLDEVGELPLHLQVKMLRVLQEGEIRPVGQEEPVKVDIRIVSATLRDLEQDVTEGRFREDLYYRLHVVSVRIPPLRERREDVPILAQHFVRKHHERLGLPLVGISKDALQLLMDYDWPGNVRELENYLERAMILSEGDQIEVSNLPKHLVHSKGVAATSTIPDNGDISIKKHTRELEEQLIRRALERTGGNRTHAARLLEISHRTLLYKLKEFGIDASE